MMVNLDCYAWKQKKVLECKTISHGTQRIAVGIHVHHVMQRKKSKIVKS
jgi:hypothetical protein